MGGSAPNQNRKLEELNSNQEDDPAMSGLSPMAASSISGKASDAPHNNFLMTQDLLDEVKKYGDTNGK